MLKIKYIFIIVLILQLKKKSIYSALWSPANIWFAQSIYITDSYIKKHLSNKKDKYISSILCA